jgi:predicted phosphodiesterase
MSLERSIFIADTHGDLVCQDAVKMVKDVIADWKPKHRVHLGDVWDFRALRKKAEAEERAEGISYDYNCGFELLEWYRPNLLTMGNHDYRLWRAARETSNGVLADLCGRLVDEAEDRMRKLKIQWCAYAVDQYLQLPMGGPKLIHGFKSSMYPAKAHFDNWGSCLFGHVHRPDSYEARHIDGGKAYALGTLADLKKMSYADHHAAKLGWRQSFRIGQHNTKTGRWNTWEITKEDGQWMSPMGIL